MALKEKCGKTAAESMDQTMGWIGVIKSTDCRPNKPPVKRNYKLMVDLRKVITHCLEARGISLSENVHHDLAKAAARVFRKYQPK